MKTIVPLVFLLFLGSFAYASRIRIGLKQQHLEQLEALFWTISDPQSPNYAKYLTAKEIGELLSIEEDIVTLKSFLANHYGAKTVEPLNGLALDWIEAELDDNDA